MKGIIFNVVEEVLEDVGGQGTWDSVLSKADDPGVYTSVGNYPDERLARLVAASAEHLEVSQADVLQTVGRKGIGVLAARYPTLFEQAGDLGTFLAGLDDTIHAEVRKIYEGAAPPGFSMAEVDDGFDLTYTSARHLPELAVGFILGSADHFGTPVTVDYLDSGDGGPIVFHIRWA